MQLLTSKGFRAYPLLRLNFAHFFHERDPKVGSHAREGQFTLVDTLAEQCHYGNKVKIYKCTYI